MIIREAIPNTEAAAEREAVPGSAGLLSALVTVHANTQAVALFIEGGNVRTTLNDDDPTGSVGVLLQDGDSVQFSRAEFDACKIIGISGAPVFQLVQYR